MHMLQRMPLENFFSILSRNRLRIISPPLKKKQLSTGGGQLSLPRDQGGYGGLRTLRCFGQPRPEGSSPACNFGFNQLQPLVVLAHMTRANF